MENFYLGDCLNWLQSLPDNFMDSFVEDPPAGISFMGKSWDSNKGGRDKWIDWLKIRLMEQLRVLKPGGYIFVWALPKTSHWTMTAIENAGFEIVDTVHHIFGSGFPKNYDLAKGVESWLLWGDASNKKWKNLPGNRTPGKTGFAKLSHNQGYRPAEYEQHGILEFTPSLPESAAAQGYGTALKPAHELWILAQKPIEGRNLAENFVKWGVGGLNVAACRVPRGDSDLGRVNNKSATWGSYGDGANKQAGVDPQEQTGWPANLVITHNYDCNGECSPGCPAATLNLQSGESKGTYRRESRSRKGFMISGSVNNIQEAHAPDNYGDSGGASRYFNNFHWGELDIESFIYASKPFKLEKNAGLEGLPPVQKIYNGQSSKSSKEMGDVEARFTTAPAQNSHATVKSLELMQWLIKLITPPVNHITGLEGKVGDPFAGSGSTLVAALLCGFTPMGAELMPDHYEFILKRLEWAAAQVAKGRGAAPPKKIVKAAAQEKKNHLDKGQLSLW